jgi:hypothetical protein
MRRYQRQRRIGDQFPGAKDRGMRLNLPVDDDFHDDRLIS